MNISPGRETFGEYYLTIVNVELTAVPLPVTLTMYMPDERPDTFIVKGVPAATSIVELIT